MKRSANERACVNRLIKAIRVNSPLVYIHIDRDSGSVRHTSSGWDFLISLDGRVAFCEAKLENEKLTTWQGFHRVSVISSGGQYNVVRFRNFGETFSVNDGIEKDTDAAKAEDFL